MKSILRQVSFRTLAAILGVIILSVFLYVALAAVGMDQKNAISIGTLPLMGSVAWLVIRSTEKKLGIFFICLGFSLRPIVSFFLPRFGTSQSLASTISILFSTAVIILGLLISGPIAKRLRPNEDQKV